MSDLVTCLCVTTRSRRTWMPNALECFERQAYKRRELVVVVDEDNDDYLLDIALQYESLGIKMRVHIYQPPTLGEKRNIGCRLASGEVIVVWDDDDFSAPERLTDQVTRLHESGRSVTAYHTMKFTNGKDWWLYEGIPSIGIGTSLCFKKEWWEKHQFPNKQVAEDNAFVSEAARARELISVPAGELMYATIHPDNTSARDLSGYRKL